MDEDLSQIVCVPLAPALDTQERLDAVRSACVYIAKYATKPLVKKKRERPLYTYNFSPPSTPRGNHTIAIDADTVTTRCSKKKLMSIQQENRLILSALRVADEINCMQQAVLRVQ